MEQNKFFPAIVGLMFVFSVGWGAAKIHYSDIENSSSGKVTVESNVDSVINQSQTTEIVTDTPNGFVVKFESIKKNSANEGNDNDKSQ